MLTRSWPVSVIDPAVALKSIDDFSSMISRSHISSVLMMLRVCNNEIGKRRQGGWG